MVTTGSERCVMVTTGSERCIMVTTFSPPKSFTWPNTMKRKFKRNKDRMPSVITGTVQYGMVRHGMVQYSKEGFISKQRKQEKRTAYKSGKKSEQKK
jgi:hypothetical protein